MNISKITLTLALLTSLNSFAYSEAETDKEVCEAYISGEAEGLHRYADIREESEPIDDVYFEMLEDNYLGHFCNDIDLDNTDCYIESEIYFEEELSKLCLKAGKEGTCEDVSVHSGKEGEAIYKEYLRRNKVCKGE